MIKVAFLILLKKGQNLLYCFKKKVAHNYRKTTLFIAVKNVGVRYIETSRNISKMVENF